MNPTLSQYLPSGADQPLADWSAAFASEGQLPANVRGDVSKALGLARAFCQEVVTPLAVELDGRIQDSPELLPDEFIRTAAQWRLFSRWIPRMMGGEGWHLLSLYAFLEEVSSHCVGLANVIGVHYLGVATLTATWNLSLMSRVFADVRAGERKGEPCLVSLAITEPDAGTDVEETVLLDRATLGTHGQREPDGSYRLNGRKVFISNGHVSRWHMVICYQDRKKAADTMMVLAVHKHLPGFSLGAQEHKMGQRACVASELIFDDCRVPADCVAFDPEQTRGFSRSHHEIGQTIIDYVVSSTRAGVGAFAAGVAQGALRHALEYSHNHSHSHSGASKRLIDRQMVQTTLADMAANARQARQAWLESAFYNTGFGLFAKLSEPFSQQLERMAPGFFYRPVSGWVMRRSLSTNWIRKQLLDSYPEHCQHGSSGLASLAKFTCSDLAIENADKAMELMGADGLRHSQGVEKLLRDAKLLQIYEGTNQLNRINLLKCLLAGRSDAILFRQEYSA